jgi:hypothetical protein
LHFIKLEFLTQRYGNCGVGDAKAIMENTVFKEFWELDKQNSMFTKLFIDSIDSASHTGFSGFMGISRKMGE